MHTACVCVPVMCFHTTLNTQVPIADICAPTIRRASCAALMTVAMGVRGTAVDVADAADAGTAVDVADAADAVVAADVVSPPS